MLGHHSLDRRAAMGDYTTKRIDDMEAVFRGAFKRARAELGVGAFGMQVLDMPPNLDAYPEHDHAESGQEEVFVVLRGSGEIEVDGERVAIDPETFVRVGPQARRKFWPGDEGMRVLALGGVPGKPYEAPDVTKLGEPDPMG
jgi:mannose-6-phosphate isomerase-like protein (cupin superfamily)